MKWDTGLDEQAFLARLETLIPPHLVPGLHRYVTQRIAPGSFLRAVLENDLKEAVFRADASGNLESVVYVLHNYAPGQCWGSKEAVEKWLERKS